MTSSIKVFFTLVLLASPIYSMVREIIMLNNQIANLTNEFTSTLLGKKNKIVIEENFIPKTDDPFEKSTAAFNKMENCLKNLLTERTMAKRRYDRNYQHLNKKKYGTPDINTPNKLFNGNLEDVLFFFQLGVVTNKSAPIKFFEDILEYSQDTKIEVETRELVALVQYYVNEQKELKNLNVEQMSARLKGPDGLLANLRGASGHYSVNKLPSLIRKIKENRLTIPKEINDISFSAFGLICSSFTTYMKIMSFLVQGYHFLAQAHYQKREFDKYNKYLSEQLNLFKEFKLSILYNNNPINNIKQVFNAIKKLKHSQFVKTNINKFIDRYVEILDKMETEMAKDIFFLGNKPEDLKIKYDFSSSKVQTPIGNWKNGSRLKYAVQLKRGENIYFVSKWSQIYTVEETANPIINLKKINSDLNWRKIPTDIEQIIFRQIDGSLPELVGIIDIKQTKFHDIDRDVYNSASDANEHVATREIELFLANGADINLKFDKGRTAIHAAIENGHKNLIEILFKKYKVEVNPKDYQGCTSMHLASLNGEVEILKMLIENGADINERTDNDWTPLHFAVQGGDQYTLEYLISGGADINAKTDIGLTSLHLGVLHGNIEAIRILLKNMNTDSSAHSYLGFSPLHLASINGNLEIVQELIGENNVNIDLEEPSHGGFTPMHFAVFSENLELLNYLLRNSNINFEIISDDYFTPLHLAVVLKNENMINKLLDDHRTNINSKCRAGLTPLHLATIKGNKNTALRLIEMGVSLDITDRDGKTALHLAAEEGQLDLVELIVKNGANINARENYQYTPLSLAVFNNHIEIVNYLLNNDADISIRNALWMTPLDIATIIRSTENREMINLFLNRSNFTSLHNAAFIGDSYLVLKMIEQGYDIDETDDLGRTALHEAVIGENLGIIHILRNNKDINKQAIPDNRDNFGNTPRHLAALIGNTFIFDYFSQINVDSEESDNVNNTLLHLAARSGNVQILRKIISKFSTIDINSRNEDGYSPLHIAALHGHENAVDFLVNEKQANTFILNNLKRSPLFEAARFGHWNIVEKLSQKLHSYEAFNTYGNVLNFAARDNQEDIINRWVKEYGLSVNFKDENGQTPIFWASKHNAEFVIALVKLGANLSFCDNSGKTLLHEASSNGNFQLVVHLVEKVNFDVNSLDYDLFTTPLHLAASNGHVDIVKYLIIRGSNIDALDINNNTAVMRAIINREWETAEVLIENGADVNIKNDEGNNGLHVSVKHRSNVLTKLLITIIRDINALNNNNMSALQIAFKQDDINIVAYLLEFEADINLKDNEENGILHLISINGNLPVLTYFDSYTRFDDDFQTNINSLNPIHLASEKGYLNIINHYVKENENFCAKKYSKGISCLIISATNGHLPVVKYLCEKNTKNATNEAEEAFSVAVARGHLPIIKYLFSKFQIDVNFKDKNGLSLVETSSKYGYLDVLKFLVENGANVNEQVTILASKFGHLSILKFLVEERNVGIEIQDTTGKNPLIWASINGFLPLVNYLISRNSSIAEHKDEDNRNALIWATNFGNIDVIKLFISKYLEDVNTVDNNGLHIPMIACEKGHLEVIKFFIYYKHTYVNLKSKNGNSCLMLACSGGHLNVVKYMLRLGADLEAVNNFGETPLMLACENGNLQLIKHIVGNSNIEINVTNNVGNTALWKAAKSGHLHVIKYFLDRERNATTKEQQLNILQIAIYEGHLNVVKYLIEEKGYDVTQKKFIFDPLWVAIKRNYWEMVEYLVTKKDFQMKERIKHQLIQHRIRSDEFSTFDYFKRDTYKLGEMNTKVEMLALACKAGLFDVVKEMTENMNDLNKFSSYSIHRGVPIFFYAIESGNLKLVKFLLEDKHLEEIFGATNNDKKNCLMVAASFGHVNVLKYLIGTEILNLNDKDRSGKTVLDHAILNGKTAVIKYLVDDLKVKLDLITDEKTAFFNAADKGFLKLLKYFIDIKKVDINLTDEKKRNVLMYASIKGQFKLVKYLVNETKINPNRKDEDGYTALIFASKNGHIDLVQYFVDDVGVSLNDADNYGRTALMHTIMNGRFVIFDYFIQSKKNVTVDNYDKFGNTCLMLATKSGFLNIFLSLLRLGTIDLYAVNNNGRDALALAVQENQLSMVSFLIDNIGINFRNRDKNGLTLLMIAAENGYLNILDFLYFKDNRIIFDTDDSGNTALLHASFNGHLEVVKYLVNRNDDILVVNNENISPMEAAAGNGHLRTVIYFIEKDLKFYNSEIYKAFIQACENSKLEIIKYFIDNKFVTSLNRDQLRVHKYCDVEAIKYISDRGFDLNITTSEDVSLLHFASLEGNIRLVKYLVEEKGFDIHAKCRKYSMKPYFFTALPSTTSLKQKYWPKNYHFNKTKNNMDVQKLKQLNVLKYFAENKSMDMTYRDIKGRSVLMYASFYNQFEIVKYLVENSNITIDEKEMSGETNLHYATSEGHLHIIKYLVEKGANIRITDNKGVNVLMYATYFGQLEIVEYYVENGIEINERDKAGKTALFYALHNKNFKIFYYLLKKGANVNIVSYHGENILMNAAFSNCYEITEYLIENLHFAIDQKDNHGMSALFYAISNKHLDILKFLVEKGADIHIRDNEGVNILMYAVYFGHYEIVKYLVERTNIEIDATSKTGETALMYAAYQGQLDIFKLLVQKGANVYITNKFNEDIFKIAVDMGHFEIKNYLVESVYKIDQRVDL